MEKDIKCGLIGNSPFFRAALEVARKVAPSSASIFLAGESGTGKEMFAKYIHGQSLQKRGPFVAINCSAIPENLLESELFGHNKGSFTGAAERRIGLFEEAQNGTIFLDEIGDLGLSLQAKLLRVLQERQIKRVGDNQMRAVNCRVISATHRNLANEVKLGHFREDLFFRLNVIPIQLPPLRDRREDIPALAQTFLERYSQENNVSLREISSEAMSYLLERPWSGNVRELQNAIERAVILAESDVLQVRDFLPTLQRESSSVEVGNGNIFSLNMSEKLLTVQEVANRYIEFAVGKNGGARDRTAREIGIDRKTLSRRIKTESLSSLRRAGIGASGTIGINAYP